jgi:hypothetical protein
VRVPSRRDVRELPAGKPERGEPRRSVSELSTSLRSKLWETVCWLQGSISSVLRLRWPTLVNSSSRRLRHTNLFRWRVVLRRSLCVGSRSLRELAKNRDIRESRQNLPSVEVRKNRIDIPQGTSSRILIPNLAVRRAAKAQRAQQREVLPRFLGRGFFTQAVAAIVSAHQYRYRSCRLSGGIVILLFSFFSSLRQLHV